MRFGFRRTGSCLASRSRDRGFRTGPHGERQKTGIIDKTVRVWDVVTGKQISSIDAGEISTLSFSPDGRSVWRSGGSDGVDAVTVWEAATGRESYTGAVVP